MPKLLSNRSRFITVGLVLLPIVLGGCSLNDAEGPAQQRQSESATQAAPESATPTPPEETAVPPSPLTSDGQPQVAHLSIPDLNLHDLRVEPYQGQTDDAPGTRIQDGGIAASPHGPNGGTGPGGIGNYQVTAHRNTAGGPFFTLPDLRKGARIKVVTEQRTYIYEVIETRETSFRSEQSLAEQRAPVPGHPGQAPTQAMITLSTCATQEDHAEGNYWADELSNPEHRIDKIGVLVESRPT